MAEAPLVGIIMGSKSDMPAMEACTAELEELGVPYELVIASAHRAPQKVHDWASTAADRGLKVIIAAAGKAAHLGGVVAAYTPLPIVGVPMKTSDLGGMDKFKAAFQQAGLSQFGSGWAWLILTPDGKLAVTATPNQDNPLMDLAPVKGTPILANDVWEHAYYLTYRNRRGDYLGNWWNVVNWGRVNELYAEAIAKR